MTRSLLCVAPLLGALACSPARDSVDASDVCLGAPVDARGDGPLEADTPMEVHVRFRQHCHSTDVAVSCEAALEGDQLVVRTVESWVREHQDSCADPTVTTCEAPALADGTYTLVVGDRDPMPFTVPSDTGVCSYPLGRE